MFAIVIRSSGDESTGLDAAFAFDRVKADEVKGDVFENGQVMGGVPGTGAHLVVGEGDIHAPVQSIFHGPMRPNCCKQSLGVGGQTADVEAPLD